MRAATVRERSLSSYRLSRRRRLGGCRRFNRFNRFTGLGPFCRPRSRAARRGGSRRSALYSGGLTKLLETLPDVIAQARDVGRHVGVGGQTEEQLAIVALHGDPYPQLIEIGR